MDVYSVKQTVTYIKRLLNDDFALQDISVSGEVTNLKIYPSGHVYFSLKDDYASLNCVMFSAYVKGAAFENGAQSVVTGYVSVYEKTGQMQFYAREIRVSGVGQSHESFEKLKNKLAKEGLFDEARKKPIPKFIKSVAVITSPVGAVVFDIIRIVKKRNPTVKITVIPAKVQGEGAAESLRDAIETANAWGGAQCVIIGRGGGSNEDLSAFNAEILARAVARSEIPVISAVGHETDFTICDFAADLRCATPSAAAVAVAFDRAETRDAVLAAQSKARNILTLKIKAAKAVYKALASRRVLLAPQEALYNRQMFAEHLRKRADAAFLNRLAALKSKVAYARSIIKNLSPEKTLERGFALVTEPGGAIVKNGGGFTQNGALNIYLSDGLLKAVALSYERGKKINF